MEKFFAHTEKTFFAAKSKMFTENVTCLTWSQGQMIPPENIKRYPMATKQAQMTREKTRRSFLKIDSIQTRMNTARKMASAVGTVMTKATWSSTFWEEMAQNTETQAEIECTEKEAAKETKLTWEKKQTPNELRRETLKQALHNLLKASVLFYFSEYISPVKLLSSYH